MKAAVPFRSARVKTQLIGHARVVNGQADSSADIVRVEKSLPAGLRRQVQHRHKSERIGRREVAIDIGRDQATRIHRINHQGFVGNRLRRTLNFAGKEYSFVGGGQLKIARS